MFRVSRPVLVQVVGPPGAGKTTLIERSLRSTRNATLAAVRVVEEDVDAVARDEEGAEVASWRAAGAIVPQSVRMPVGHPHGVHAALQACGPGLSAADVVLVEGGPVGRRDVDVVAFVTRALGDGESLAVDEAREVGRMDGGEALSLMLGLTPLSEEEAEEAGLPTEGEVIDEDDDVEVGETIEIPEPAAARIRELLAHGHPLMQRGRWLREGYEGLVHAHVVVVQPGPDGDRGLADRTKGMIEAALGDEELRRTYPDVRYVHRRTIVLADLAGARDPGARKVVESLKRRWRRAAW